MSVPTSHRRSLWLPAASRHDTRLSTPVALRSHHNFFLYQLGKDLDFLLRRQVQNVQAACLLRQMPCMHTLALAVPLPGHLASCSLHHVGQAHTCADTELLVGPILLSLVIEIHPEMQGAQICFPSKKRSLERDRR